MCMYMPRPRPRPLLAADLDRVDDQYRMGLVELLLGRVLLAMHPKVGHVECTHARANRVPLPTVRTHAPIPAS